MKTSARLLFACLALLLAPLTALAANTFTDRTSFLSEIVAGTVVDGNFNDLNIGNFYTSPLPARTVAPYSYVASTGDGSVFIPAGTTTPVTDVWLTSGNDNTIINFAIQNQGNPVEAFGGQFFAIDATTGLFASREVTVSINGGAFTISKTPTSIADSFFGFIVGTDPTGTTGGISSVQMTVGATANTKVGTNSVTFAVPEPSTYALLGFAVTTGGLCRIRRRLKIAA